MKNNVNIKNVLFVLFLFGAGSASAELIKVNATAKFENYVEKSTIREDGGLHKVWTVLSYKEPFKPNVMSIRLREEYDCKSKRIRRISISYHSEPMALGNIVLNMPEDATAGWLDIDPKSYVEGTRKIVCGLDTPTSPATPPTPLFAKISQNIQPIRAAMVCTKMGKPKFPSVSWKGEAIYKVTATVKAGRVSSIEMVLPGGVDRKAQRAFISAIETTLRDTYECPGDHVFEQLFQFNVS